MILGLLERWHATQAKHCELGIWLLQQRFAYQKTKWLTNTINYARWTQAWAFYALSMLDNRMRAV